MKLALILTSIMITSTPALANENCANDASSLKEIASAAAEISTTAVRDYREVVNRKSSEFSQLNAIGIVSKNGKSFDGTGFMVSECVMLTNKHVVNKDRESIRHGEEVTFKVGQSGSKSAPFTHSSKGRVIAFGSENTRAYDWALVKLDKSIGKEVGHIQIYQMEDRDHMRKAIVTAGFPYDKTSRGTNFSNIYGDLDCKSQGAGSEGEFVHTCQTTGGQSGSPLLMKSAKNGKYYAIGMVQGVFGSGMDRGNSIESYNTGVSFASGKKNNLVTSADEIVEALSKTTCD